MAVSACGRARQVHPHAALVLVDHCPALVQGTVHAVADGELGRSYAAVGRTRTPRRLARPQDIAAVGRVAWAFAAALPARPAPCQRLADNTGALPALSGRAEHHAKLGISLYWTRPMSCGKLGSRVYIDTHRSPTKEEAAHVRPRAARPQRQRRRRRPWRVPRQRQRQPPGRPGCGNCAIADPRSTRPAGKHRQGGTGNHRHARSSTPAPWTRARQAHRGRAHRRRARRDRCISWQDKCWVQRAPDGEGWEIYTVLPDSQTSTTTTTAAPGAATPRQPRSRVRPARPRLPAAARGARPGRRDRPSEPSRAARGRPPGSHWPLGLSLRSCRPGG